MAKLTLLDISLPNQPTAANTVNENSNRIEAAMEKTLSRDGTSPNAMGTDFDMNNHRILNLPAPVSNTDVVRKYDLDQAIDGVTGGGSSITPAALTKVDDTNVTLTLGGTPATALLQPVTLTLGWTGTLGSARLNGNVVQAITNDTNITGSISVQNLSLGWTGTLAVARGGTGGGTASGALLDNISGFSSTGTLVRTGSGTYAFRTLTAPAAGLTVTNGNGVSGNPTLALANDLAAIEGLSTTGLPARTAADTWTTRTITGTANRLTVTNGDGVAGDPVLNISTAYIGQNTITTLGTITAGTWNGTAIATTYGGAPSGGSTGQVLIKNSNTSYDYTWSTPAGGGDVTGPAGATSGALVRFADSTGKLLANSVIQQDGSGNLTSVGTINGVTIDNTGWTAYTPTITAATGTITTLGTVSGYYKQIGKLVYISLRATITTKGTAAGNFIFTIPVTAASSRTPGWFGTSFEGGVTGKSGVAYIVSGATTGQARDSASVSYFADGAIISVTMFYEAA